jgi:hypothetical protein
MHAKGSRNKKELTWKSEKQEKKTKMDRVSGHNWSDIGLNEATQQTVRLFCLPTNKAVLQDKKLWYL